MEFLIQKKVLDLGIKIRGVLIEGVDNHSINEEYRKWRYEKVQMLIRQYADFNVKEDEILEAYYKLHEKVQVPRRKNLSAPENLIRLLQKKGDLTDINKIVDIYNILSLETKLALGAHDIDKIKGNIRLRMTDGTEQFLPLGAEENKAVKANEYAYIDDNNDVLCWLEIRQVEKDKVNEDSRNIFYVVQGNEKTEDQLLEDGCASLIEWTTRFAGGNGRTIGSIYE